MAFAVDNESKAPKQIKHNITEHHLASHYDGTICVRKILLKMVPFGL